MMVAKWDIPKHNHGKNLVLMQVSSNMRILCNGIEEVESPYSKDDDHEERPCL